MIDGKNGFDQPISNDFKDKKILENFYWSKRLLYNWLFVRLSLLQRKLQNNCRRVK